jgi:hypothetical protein
MTTASELKTPETAALAADANQAPLTGRSVFMVETVAAGVAVRPAFLTEDGRLLDLPAVFPDQTYAMAQIDELRRLVSAHFAQAAQVGAQVIAAQAANTAAGASGPAVTVAATTANTPGATAPAKSEEKAKAKA